MPFDKKQDFGAGLIRVEHFEGEIKLKIALHTGMLTVVLPWQNALRLAEQLIDAVNEVRE